MTTVPIVFRIRNPELRKRFEKFVEAEAGRVGYRLNGTEVAERAISEFLQRRETKKRGTP